MKRAWLWPVLGAAVVLQLTGFSAVSYASSDPYLSLLSSQSLLAHGTVRLDPYAETAVPPLDSYGSTGMIDRRDGHYFYYPPPGPTLFALPFVAVANGLGLDMQVRADNFDVQRIASAALATLNFLLLYAIVATFLPPQTALLITLISVLGSTLVSTVGTALWNHGVAVLAVNGALLLLVRYDTGKSTSPRPFWLGVLLFAAYLSRPTTAVFIALAFFYLLLRARRDLPVTAFVAGGLMLLFMAWSRNEYGQLFPPYYDAGGRVSVQSARYSLGTAVIGHTFSPSRGLFVFSPFLLLVVAGVIAYGRRLAGRPLFWLALVWVTGHVWIVSRATRWWGGHSYGPRLLTEMLPALVLLTALGWSVVGPVLGQRRRRGVTAVYVTLGVAAIFIHSVQGLYNINAQRWNGGIEPNIDAHTEYLFDWQYPQFLATNDNLCRRQSEFFERRRAEDEGRLSPFTADTSWQVYAPAERAVLVGWGGVEGSHRWSVCPEAAIRFLLPDSPVTATYTMSMTARSLGAQGIQVTVNGATAGTMDYNSLGTPESRTLTVEGAWLKPGVVNEVRFAFPDARYPFRETRSYTDQRRLALGIVAWQLVPDKR